MRLQRGVSSKPCRRRGGKGCSGNSSHLDDLLDSPWPCSKLFCHARLQCPPTFSWGQHNCQSVPWVRGFTAPIPVPVQHRVVCGALGVVPGVAQETTRLARPSPWGTARRPPTIALVSRWCSRGDAGTAETRPPDPAPPRPLRGSGCRRSRRRPPDAGHRPRGRLPYHRPERTCEALRCRTCLVEHALPDVVLHGTAPLSAFARCI